MLHLYRKLPSFNAVAAGQTANITIPKGPSYRQIVLRYKKVGVDATEAQMAADLTAIRVKVNGVSRIDVSAAHLISIIKYMGFTIDPGILPIFLALPTARTPVIEEALVWGTANVDTLNLEIDIGAAAGAVTLEADTWYTAEARPLGAIMAYTTLTTAPSAAGVFEVNTLPKSNGDLAGLHIFSGLVTATELVMDALQYIDGGQDALQSTYKWTGRVPQTNIVHIEPTWLDRYDDRIPLVGKQDVRLKLTCSGAGTIPIVMQTLTAPLGL